MTAVHQAQEETSNVVSEESSSSSEEVQTTALGDNSKVSASSPSSSSQEQEQEKQKQKQHPVGLQIPLQDAQAALLRLQSLLHSPGVVNSSVAQALAPLQPQQQLQLLQSLQQQQASTIHNLIPSHLQPTAWASTSLNGTPGHQPALIAPLLAASIAKASSSLFGASNTTIEDPIAPPVLTVQDRPMNPPVYNGVNPQYPGLRVVHSSPPIFCVDNFLSPFECDFLITVAQDSFGPAPVVGKGAGEISPSRTSSTCYLAREDVPDIMRKVSLLTGKPVEHCELPQVGRYLPSQQYLQHFDAFDLGSEDGLRFASNGGQRTITVLIYLNDVQNGGATRFPALGVDVQPRRGMAMVFFPATVDGYLDKMALHAALPAVDVKYVSQVWIRQSNYNGQPSKRLPQTLGLPFGQEGTIVAHPAVRSSQQAASQPAAAALQNLQQQLQLQQLQQQGFQNGQQQQQQHVQQHHQQGFQNGQQQQLLQQQQHQQQALATSMSHPF